MDTRIEGVIKRLEKHHGIVSSDSMEDLFFNAFDLNYENANEGDKVNFISKKNKRGSYEAVSIDLLKKSDFLKKSHKRKFHTLTRATQKNEWRRRRSLYHDMSAIT